MSQQQQLQHRHKNNNNSKSPRWSTNDDIKLLQYICSHYDQYKQNNLNFFRNLSEHSEQIFEHKRKREQIRGRLTAIINLYYNKVNIFDAVEEFLDLEEGFNQQQDISPSSPNNKNTDSGNNDNKNYNRYHNNSKNNNTIDETNNNKCISDKLLTNDDNFTLKKLARSLSHLRTPITELSTMTIATAMNNNPITTTATTTTTTSSPLNNQIDSNNNADNATNDDDDITASMALNELSTSTFEKCGGIDGDNKTNIDVDLKSTSTIVTPNVGSGSYSPTTTPSPPPPSVTGTSTLEEIEIKSNVEENYNSKFRSKTLKESIVEIIHSSASTTPNDSPKTLMNQQQEQQLIIPFVSPPPTLLPVFSTLSLAKTFNQKEDETVTITKDSDNNSNSNSLSLCDKNNHNYYQPLPSSSSSHSSSNYDDTNNINTNHIIIDNLPNAPTKQDYDVIIDNIKNQIFLIEELFQKEKIRYETRFNYMDSIIDLFLQMQNKLNKMKLQN